MRMLTRWKARRSIVMRSHKDRSGFFVAWVSSFGEIFMFEKVIEVAHLRKEFGNAVAVKDLSFEVRRGEIVGFLGANGAGKTTTLYMLLGLTTPTKGSINLFGTTME